MLAFRADYTLLDLDSQKQKAALENLKRSLN